MLNTTLVVLYDQNAETVICKKSRSNLYTSTQSSSGPDRLRVGVKIENNTVNDRHYGTLTGNEKEGVKYPDEVCKWFVDNTRSVIRGTTLIHNDIQS